MNMNNVRILRVLNSFLILTGYQLHWFEEQPRRYRLSLLAIGNYVGLALLYIIGFNQHFEQSGLLYMLQNVSPFLWNLTRLHLLMGLKIFIFLLYDVGTLTRAANGLLEVVLPRASGRQFSRDEAFAYTLMFSTLLICLLFVLYIAIEMKFVLPPIDHILVALGLFMPHFTLAGVLRLHSVGSWLLRSELYCLAAELDGVVSPLTEITFSRMKVHMPIVECPPDEQSLLDISRQLENFVGKYKDFNSALRKQLLLLLALNTNCLLWGAYSLVYFQTSWYVLFVARQKRIFYAANIGIFVFIFWDCVCLCVGQASFDRVKRDFATTVEIALNRVQRVTGEPRRILKNMREVLVDQLHFKLIGPFNLNVWNLLLIQKFVGLALSMIVTYHYLNDKISALTEQFDTLTAEDR